MEEVKEVISKVKSYNLKVENIKKINKVALEEEEGNKSKAINKIVEKY